MKAYPTILLIVFSALIFGTSLCAVSVQVTGVYGGGTINGVISTGDEITINLEAKESGVSYSIFDYKDILMGDNSIQSTLEARSYQGSLWSNITSNFLFSPISNEDLNQTGVQHNLYLNDQNSYFELEINGTGNSTGLTLDLGGNHIAESVDRFEILIRNDEFDNGWNSVPGTSITHSDFLSHNYSSYSPSNVSGASGNISFYGSSGAQYHFDITNLSIVPEPSTYILPDFHLSDSFEIIEDSSLIITPVITAGYPESYNYQWYFNDFPIPAMFGGASESYTVSGDAQYEGNWKVEISNEAGTATKNFSVVIRYDTDGDGIFDYKESNTGIWVSENDTGTDPNNPDTDGDNIWDNIDLFPHNSSEWADTDNDSVGDNADAFPNDPNETTDTDNDGVGDNADVFPNDSSEWADTDNDSVGDNADAFPNDPNETTDTDNDGVGNNTDVDDDADSLSDSKESAFGTDPLVQDNFNSLIGIINTTDWSYLSDGNPTQSQYDLVKLERDQVISAGDALQLSLDEFNDYSIPRIDINEVLTTWLGYVYDPVDDVHKIDPSVDVDQKKSEYLAYFRGILDGGPFSKELKDEVIFGLRIAINHKISREYWKARTKSLPSQNQYENVISERDQARLERDARPTQDELNIVIAERDQARIERDARPSQSALDAIIAANAGKYSLDEVKDLKLDSTQIEFVNNVSDTKILRYDPNELIANINGQLYKADPYWDYPQDEWPSVQNGGLLLITDISSTLQNSNSFSFEIEGLEYGTGTFNELGTKLSNNEVIFNFNVNGQEYSTTEESIFIKTASSWGTQTATYNYSVEGLSLNFVYNSIFEIYGDYGFFHTAYYENNDSPTDLFITSGSNYNVFSVDETNPPLGFTLFYPSDPVTKNLLLTSRIKEKEYQGNWADVVPVSEEMPEDENAEKKFYRFKIQDTVLSNSGAQN